jgi:hypothetical protein
VTWRSNAWNQLPFHRAATTQRRRRLRLRGISWSAANSAMPATTLEIAMPDLFPTTDEAEKDQNIADAAAGKRSIVNHVGPDSFDKDGLRPFFEYRSLGLEELTGGKVGAQVLRAKPGQYADALRHSHTLEFQFIYVPKAGRSSTTKAMASTSWSPARPSISRPESRARRSTIRRISKCWRSPCRRISRPTRRSSPFKSAPRGAILAA